MSRLASIRQSSIRFDVLERYLIVASVVYLAIPHFIFGAGWLRWPWAVLYVGPLAAALVEVARNRVWRGAGQELAQEDAPRFTLLHAALILAACFAWIFPAGVAGYGFQKGDWAKHEVIIKALIDEPWPPIFVFYDQMVGLVFYVAYYLPGVVVGKLMGWNAAHHALFVWTYIGLALAMTWFCALVRRVSLPLIVLFGAFSGQDVVAAAIARWADWSTVRPGIVPDLESWSHMLQYSSFTTLLLWVPHQGVAGWLAASLVLYSVVYARRRKLVLLAFALSALFSPFVTIGLGLYLVVDFLADFPGDRGGLGQRIRSYVSIANASGIVMLLIIGVYYMTKLFEVSPFVAVDQQKGFYFSQYRGPMLDAIGVLIVFWILEFGLYAWLVYWGLRHEEKKWRVVYLATVVYLFLIPLYKYGLYNDFVMRVSIPPLFILAVFVGRMLYNRAVPTVVRGGLVALLLLGVITPLGEVKSHVGRLVKTQTWIAIPAYETVHTYTDFYRTVIRLGINYIGPQDAPFFRHIAREHGGPYQKFPEEMPVVSFDDLILLADYPAPPLRPLRPGDSFRVELPLQGVQPKIDRDYDVVLRLVDAEGREWARNQGWVQDRPTSVWVDFVEWPDTRELTIPAGAPAGTYRLELGIIESDTQEPLYPYVVASGERLADRVRVGEVSVGVSVSSAP